MTSAAVTGLDVFIPRNRVAVKPATPMVPSDEKATRLRRSTAQEMPLVAASHNIVAATAMATRPAAAVHGGRSTSAIRVASKFVPQKTAAMALRASAPPSLREIGVWVRFETDMTTSLDYWSPAQGALSK